jgi:hypothetical protein
MQRWHRAAMRRRRCARILSGFGGVAQLGERRVRNAKVRSSILLVSTITASEARACSGLFLAPLPRVLSSAFRPVEVCRGPDAQRDRVGGTPLRLLCVARYIRTLRCS